MTMPDASCRELSRRLAAGEALSAAAAEHVRGCATCQAMAHTAAALAAAFAARPRPATDPGLSQRLEAGAWARRQRSARGVLAGAGVVAVAAAAVLAIGFGLRPRGQSPATAGTETGAGAPAKARKPGADVFAPALREATVPEPPEGAAPSPGADAEVVSGLFALADVDHALGPVVAWDQIIAPLDEIRELAPGAMPLVGTRRMP